MAGRAEDESLGADRQAQLGHGQFEYFGNHASGLLRDLARQFPLDHVLEDFVRLSADDWQTV